ncbi:15334_t:CDS:1, partial [Dentiscutata heterogama]
LQIKKTSLTLLIPYWYLIGALLSTIALIDTLWTSFGTKIGCNRSSLLNFVLPV